MPGLAARGRQWRPVFVGVALLAAALAWGPVAQAQPSRPTTAPAPAQVPAPAAVAATGETKAGATPTPSALDAPLFYQLLIGEIELRSGRPGNAYEVILDAARRQGDEALYQRAVDIALQARAGEQALAAVRSWRSAKPRSVTPLRYETQLLLALGQTEALAQTLAQWLALASGSERAGLIMGLPSLLQRLPKTSEVPGLVAQLTAPYRTAAETRSAVRLAMARAHWVAGDAGQALALALALQQDDPTLPGTALLGLELMAKLPQAQTLLTNYLSRPDAEPVVRMAHVRQLMQAHRYAEASTQLETLTSARPEATEPWLMLGALRLELRQLAPAEQALLRYLHLADAPPPAAAAPGNTGSTGSSGRDPHAGDEESADAAAQRQGAATAAGRNQARLLLAQVAEQRGDLPAAEGWLAQVDNPQAMLEVLSRRATLMAKQGQLEQARALLQNSPERNEEDQRAKLMAEAQLLRELKLWRETEEVLGLGLKRQADDIDMLYELAMVQEKQNRLAEMEALLRRVIELKPEHAHAHNALGYSLADRGLRLDEARQLIVRALEITPGDPFITDSLGWVEFRLGRNQEALRLLQQAYQARPDTEIAAHLGEVLWVLGQREEARRIWLEGQQRDAANEVLRETLTRLKVAL